MAQSPKSIDLGFGPPLQCSYRAAQEERRARREEHEMFEECERRRRSKLYDGMADMRGKGTAHLQSQETKSVY